MVTICKWCKQNTFRVPTKYYKSFNLPNYYYSKRIVTVYIIITLSCHSRVTAVEFPNQYAIVETQTRNWTSQNITYIKENYAHVKIYFDTFEYVMNEQFPAMTWDQMVADIGGQLGICLGASIITIAEVLDCGMLAVMSFYRKVKRRPDSSRENTTTTTAVKQITSVNQITPIDM